MIDQKFQERVREAKVDITFWWKRKYNISRSDERYLNATEDQMLEDYIDEKIALYLDEFDDNPEGERIIRGRALDPEFDKKEQEKFKRQLKNIKVLK